MTIVLRLLLRRLDALGKIIRGREGTKVAVMGGFVLLFGLVMLGEYLMFRQGLVEVLNIGPLSAPMVLYVVESFLVLVLVISVISFVATGLWTFYRAADTAFLLSTPLSLTHLFWLRAAETFLLTSWALVVLGVPAFLALGAAHGAGAPFYLRALAILILLMALGGGLGALLTSLAGALFGRRPIRTRIALTTVILAGAFGALLVSRHVVPSALDFYLIFEPGIPNGKTQSVKFVETRFWLWPTHPLAVTLYAGLRVVTVGSDAAAVAALGLPALALGAAAAVGGRLFAATLPVAAEGFRPSTGTRVPRGGVTFPRVLSGPVGALVERDLVALARNPQEWGRAAFIVFLLGLSTAILFVAPLGKVLESPDTVARLFFLDLMAVGYFVTAFGIRFVFPSLSLEGRTAWIVFSSPLSSGRLFVGKLLTYSALLIVAVGPIAMGGALRLLSAPVLLAAFGALLVLVIVTTVTVALAFGVLWPDFKETSAERVATNAGGLATIILCLGYVAVVAWLGRESARAFFAAKSLLPSLAGAVALSAAVFAGSVWAARRRFKTLEIL